MFTASMNLLDLTSQQLRRAAAIKDKMAALTKELSRILGDSRTGPAAKNHRSMSTSARRKIAAAQKARWAKTRKTKPSTAAHKSAIKKSKMSAAARARVSAQMKKYWRAKKAERSN